jgi:hypothetical protein
MARLAIKTKPKKGRPFKNDPAKTYENKSYIVTTFRLSKVSVVQADAISEVLQLGSRTAAVQYALGRAFAALRSEPDIKTVSSRLARALKITNFPG